MNILVEPEVVIKAFNQTNEKFQVQFNLELILSFSLYKDRLFSVIAHLQLEITFLMPVSTAHVKN